MKKYILLNILLLVLPTFVFGQTSYDALTLSQPELRGTARYLSLGGAFGALGADASAIKDNPAGLGVYRSNEFVTTFSTESFGSNSNWNGMNTSYNRNDFIFNNAAYVISLPILGNESSVLNRANFAFSFNKIKKYNRKIGARNNNQSSSFTDFLVDFTAQSMDVYNTTVTDLKGTDTYDPYTNERIPWLSLAGYHGYLINPPDTTHDNWYSLLKEGETVNPSLYFIESGSLNEFSFSWGGSFKNNLYLGFSFGVVDMDYQLKSNIYERFNTVDGFLDLTNYYIAKGTGVNLKIGAIYLPTQNLRLGLSVHTPTLYRLTEYSNFDLSTSETSNFYGPEKGFAQEVDLAGATQIQLSAAYLFGQKGLISFEYDFMNNKGMRYMFDGSTSNFKTQNSAMRDIFNNSHIFKLGTEYKWSPKLALRAGYAFMTSPHNSNYEQGKSLTLNTASTNTEYTNLFDASHLGLGIGYRSKGWFLDFTYMLKLQTMDYYPYQHLEKMSDGIIKNTLKPVTVDTKINNFVLTLGLKI